MNKVIFASFLFVLLTCCQQSWIYRQVSDGRCTFQTLWEPFLMLLPSREDHEKSGRRKLLRVAAVGGSRKASCAMDTAMGS